MWSFDLLAATRTIEKTMPFVLYRFLLCLGAGVGYLLATLAGAGTLVGFGSLGSNATSLGPVGAALGFLAFGFLMHKIRPFWLHGVKARQLALLADQAQGAAIPEGKAQLDYAKERVVQRFPSIAELFALDQNVRYTLAHLPALVPSLTASLPHPLLAKAAIWLAGRLCALNHQSILAWHFHSGTGNPWSSAITGLTVQGKHFTALLKNRLYATLFEVLGFAAAFAVLSIPFASIGASLPVETGVWPYVFALVFAWTLEAAFFDPIAQAAMMQVFIGLAQQGPDEGWEAELNRSSESFRALQEKAAR